MTKNYLIHHGIKGQKWGVRRFQNDDGTYTPLGKSRRSKQTGRKSTEELKKRSWEDLDKEIREKSGDWYWGEGVSDSFKKTVANRKKAEEKMDARLKPISEKSHRLHEKKMDLLTKYTDKHGWDKASEEQRDKMVHDFLNTPMIKKLNSAKNKLDRKGWDANDALRDAYKENILSVVLKDINYEDTKEAREFIRDIVFWD